MRVKPKTIDEWKLCPKAKKTVKRELSKWLTMLTKQADGRTGNVIRCDFTKDDFFYFTNCKDILSNDPEYKAHETNNKIIRRKQKVMLQLLLRQIMGENLRKVLKCTHCGYEGEEMLKTTNGHFRYCPKCKKVTLVSYVPTMVNATGTALSKIAKIDPEVKNIIENMLKEE